MRMIETRLRRLLERVGTRSTCPDCGKLLPGGKLPTTRIFLPVKDPLPGQTEREPLPDQCPTCSNPVFYIPEEV